MNPFRYADRLKSTIIECPLPNTRHTLRNLYTRQIAAILKSIIPDAHHARRDLYACQTITAIESRTLNARHSLWYLCTRQTAAIVERPFPDARHTLRNRSFCYFFICTYDFQPTKFIFISIIFILQRQFILSFDSKRISCLTQSIRRVTSDTAITLRIAS